MFTIRMATLSLLFGTALSPAALAAQTLGPTAPDTVLYTGRGTVTFLHAAHAERWDCVTCHHESRPEMPLASEHQKCGDCHTQTVAEPMKTSLRSAFHDAEAGQGVCYTCHKEEAAKGVEVPMRCAECHVRSSG